jgi:long-subunit acyl-CoA synthetase (AMP-forming)
MTECLPIASPVVMAASEWASVGASVHEADFATVGITCGVELAVLPNQKEMLSTGEGEVLLRGQFVNRYLNDCGKDYRRISFSLHVSGKLCVTEGCYIAEYHHQGWLRTGDLGSIDKAGRLTLTGRCKEIINRGGEKVSPHTVSLSYT